MAELTETVTLVIPCFNEAGRLKPSDFTPLPNNLSILFINDGSTDETLSLLQSWRSPAIHVHSLESNMGKAEAVRQGMLQALRESSSEWIGFWDADFSTKIDEVDHFLNYAKLFSPKVEAIWGSRIYMLGSRIRRSGIRHLTGRCFASAVGYLFPELDFYDSQCGAKLFRRSVVEQAFGQPFHTRWIFDVELALRLRTRRIIECPVREWRDVSGSKLKMWRESLRILWDLLYLRRLYPRR